MHRHKYAGLAAALFAVMTLGSVWSGPQGQLFAATLCVNPGGTGGCFAKIGDAVAAAAKNDTIQVAAGVYAEDVVIGKPLSLVGAGRSSTIINAKGLANGVYVDGLDNRGLTNVVVFGFTVTNANFGCPTASSERVLTEAAIADAYWSGDSTAVREMDARHEGLAMERLELCAAGQR